MIEQLLEIPLQFAHYAAVLFLLGVLAVVWLVPARFVYTGASRPPLVRDLRFWASVVLLFQVFVYLLLP
ncbi:MAG: hypothetical protein H7A21_16380 [Spirochaetales bacterium]|nr:hypothetical protein [Leptospiraceae bacterium]MCP5483014.1 hypothetical protein [Spirochaetales bacterium]MCP5486180.1 hypothetical protein [Spirochaetales bacterium]